MNKRIRELLSQAGVHYEVMPKDTVYEKFAELIVRECVDIVEKLPPGYNDYRDQIEDGFRRDCMEKMKYHFGIEK